MLEGNVGRCVRQPAQSKVLELPSAYSHQPPVPQIGLFCAQPFQLAPTPPLAPPPIFSPLAREWGSAACDLRLMIDLAWLLL